MTYIIISPHYKCIWDKKSTNSIQLKSHDLVVTLRVDSGVSLTAAFTQMCRSLDRLLINLTSLADLNSMFA